MLPDYVFYPILPYLDSGMICAALILFYYQISARTWSDPEPGGASSLALSVPLGYVRPE